MGTNREQYQGQPSDDLSQEDMSVTEREKAVAALQSFARKDLSNITTYDDLTVEMLNVGNALKSVVRPGETIEGRVLISKPYEGRATISTSSEENLAFISQYSLEGSQRVEHLRATIPIKEEIWQWGRRNTHAYAIDWREGEAESYFPAKDPHNPNFQQGSSQN
jgi:hypothetical protein